MTLALDMQAKEGLVMFVHGILLRRYMMEKIPHFMMLRLWELDDAIRNQGVGKVGRRRLMLIAR